MIGVVSRREQVLRALRHFDWAGMTEIQEAMGTSRTEHRSTWDAMQKLIARGLAERDSSTPPRYRITQDGLLQHARMKAQREIELLSL